MNAIRSTVALIAASVAWSSTVLADPAAGAQKTAVPAVRSVSREQVQARLKGLADQETQRLMSLESAKRTARAQGLRGSFGSLKSVAKSRAVLDAAACTGKPRIDAVTPDTMMPGDPVLVTGCGFNDSKGMLILSDGNTQMNVSGWTDSSIEATVPNLTGFADPKSVTIKVVTVEAGKSVPSKALSLKPTLVLKDISPVAAQTLACSGSFYDGIVSHMWGSTTCKTGTDTVKFGTPLRNNWTFYAVFVDAVCPGVNYPVNCNPNYAYATPVTDGYQLGKSTLPDMPVHWAGDVNYSPWIMAMGPAGTQPY